MSESVEACLGGVSEEGSYCVGSVYICELATGEFVIGWGWGGESCVTGCV